MLSTRSFAMLALAGAFTTAGPVNSVRGHFVWVSVARDTPEKPAAVIWFAESAEAGAAELVGKIQSTKLWTRTTDNRTAPVRHEVVARGDVGELRGDIKLDGPTTVEATCDYGVVSKGGAPFLLHYYAKHIANGTPADWPRLAASESLAFDLIPSRDALGLRVQARWRGKPAARVKVAVESPAGKKVELQTNDEGWARVEDERGGRYAVLATLIEADSSGKLGEKEYQQTRHYATLTFDLPAPKPAAESAPAGTEARELLRKARASRAVWEKFPGFSADLTVRIDGQQTKGRLEVAANGTAKIELADEAAKSWVGQQMHTLVDHRLPDYISDEKVTFADEDTSHPLGRRIHLGDESLHSSYRIKDDVVTEVHREDGGHTFTISVLSVTRNQERKYLPQDFTVTFWNAKTRAITSNHATHNAWTRVGGFDLPLDALEIYTAPDKRQVRQLTFSNHRLREAK